MINIVLLILFSGISLAQNFDTIAESDINQSKIAQYVYLEEDKVYDVEIIVFAYKFAALPNHLTYTNTPFFDEANAYVLAEKPDNFLVIKDETVKPENDEFTIEIDEKKSTKQALVWFEHHKSHFNLTTIWEKLLKQENIIPLIHRAWRQPETAFEKPQYVKLTSSTYKESEITNITVDTMVTPLDLEVTTEGEVIENTEPELPDYSITGKVALSKGRFLHFGHKINLVRSYLVDEEYKSMVFSLTERKQLYPNELNYFDSPWFGSIVKITEVTGDTINETQHENDSNTIMPNTLP